MKPYLSRRIPVVVAAVLALAMLTLGFLAALGVRSLVTGTASASPAAPNPGHEWSQVEGHGIDGSTYWLGTTADQALELRVNGARALRLQPDPSPSIVGGWSINSVTPGVYGGTVAGGGDSWGANRVTDNYDAVGGGVGNLAGDDAGTTNDAWSATVGGGQENTASGPLSTVAGGEGNTASGWAASVGGGLSNTASRNMSTVGGGNGNQASGDTATVAGGSSNQASGDYATVGGGVDNIATGNYATVSGGRSNTATVENSTVGGGFSNSASGSNAFVGAGYSNTASGTLAFVGSGYTNAASGDRATVGGGYQSTASGEDATVGGGQGNAASWDRATVGGGSFNTASGWAATVPGGQDNTAQGAFSFAAGQRAKANHVGSFVWADNLAFDFASVANNDFSARTTGGARFVSAIDGTGAPTAGVVLNAGESAWSTLSSRDLKENFTTAEGREVLARLAEVPVSSWNYKAQDASIRHMGPMAQDFYAAFGLGESDTSITTVDADGVALAAIQGLYELSQEEGARIQALEDENASLQQRLDNLEARVSALEGTVPSRGGSRTAPTSGLPAAWLLLGGGLALGLVGLVLAQRRVSGGRR